jgi:glycogen synthase
LARETEGKMPQRIAFVTYETPFAPCGGIAAVMSRLPRAVCKAAGVQTAVITPFHHRIPKTTNLDLDEIARGSVDYEGGKLGFSVLELVTDEISWFFIRPEREDFFAGSPHPFRVAETPEETGRTLLRGSLVFGSAVAEALGLVDPSADWTLFLQDWEAATAALALAGREGKHRSFLTLHNSYDNGVTDQELTAYGIHTQRCPGDTVLQRALACVEKPVFTVSDQFARDFTEETLQCRIMAPHLQTSLEGRLVGVDNGPFVDRVVPEDVMKEAREGNYTSLGEWKASRRSAAQAALKVLTPTEDRPVWGETRKFEGDRKVWFVFAGRDDSRQKGYDVAARALQLFLGEGGKACFLFFPIPGDEGRQGLGFLKELAENHPESVLVLPFIFREGFHAALQGATYGVMPSLYEPFGMANEFYLNGTVGIGRATGGIVQQIIPLRSARCFTPAVEGRIRSRYRPEAQPTGFLYRERDGVPSEEDDWRAINRAAYRTDGGRPDRLTERQGYPLFAAMAEALYMAIADAVRLFLDTPDLYDSLLTRGIDHIQKQFSWERAAREYLETCQGVRNAPPPGRGRPQAG